VYIVNYRAVNDKPLPQGWEMRYTNEGIPYFVDHTTRSTSFSDPRVSPNAIVGGPTYERSFRWKVGQFRHLCQVMRIYLICVFSLTNEKTNEITYSMNLALG
jgi:hypothetical protein